MISPSLRALIVTTVFATLASTSSAQAASEFDGNWSLHAVTRSGQCDPNFQLNGHIVRGIVYSQGGGSNVAGSVAPSGAVKVTVTVGPNHAQGSGRLSKASGGGTWRGQGPTGTCSGTWSAQRR